MAKSCQSHIEISDRVVTLDALHTQQNPAKYLVEEKQTDDF